MTHIFEKKLTWFNKKTLVKLLHLKYKETLYLMKNSWATLMCILYNNSQCKK